MPEPNLPQPLSDAVCRAHAGVLAAIQDSGTNIRERNANIKDLLVKLEAETLQSPIETVKGVKSDWDAPNTQIETGWESTEDRQEFENYSKGYEQARRDIIAALTP